MSCEMIHACRFCLPRLGYGLPTPLYRTVLLRCWRDSLLGAELLVSLMFRVPTEVECAGFLVFCCGKTTYGELSAIKFGPRN
jgi:hypothetical protein